MFPTAAQADTAFHERICAPLPDSTPRTSAVPLGGRFWAFWSATTASNLSDGMAMITVPWPASSLSPDNAAPEALVATAGRLPWLLLALPTGVFVDRLPRFALMVGVNSVRLVLWALLALVVFVNTAYATLLSTQVLFVRDTLGSGPTGFGLLMTFAAIGSITGGQTVAWLHGVLPHGTLPVWCLATSGVLYLLVSVFPNVPVVATVYFLSGGLVMGYSVAMTSIRQRITPDHLLGRVNAAMRTVGWGMSAVGMAAGGVLVASLAPVLGQADALRVPYTLVSVVGLVVVVSFGRRLTGLVRVYDV